MNGIVTKFLKIFMIGLPCYVDFMVKIADFGDRKIINLKFTIDKLLQIVIIMSSIKICI